MVNRSSRETPFPRIFSARFRSPLPSQIDASGAPPAPTNAENAEINVMIGKVTPTPVRASIPTPSICPI